jgi:hypothetical protein
VDPVAAESVSVQDTSRTLETAQSALNSLSKADVDEMKRFNNPPRLVKTVCEIIYLILYTSDMKGDHSWEVIKKNMLGDMRFLQKLIEYDLRECNAVQAKGAKALINKMCEELNIEI